MQQESLCRELLRRIFPDKEILGIRFQEEPETGSFAQVEKNILNGISAKSIRLDVLFKGEMGWADIELQVQREKHLPKRSRYYHAGTDLHILPSGENYDRLKPVYVIFICFFDYFEQGEPMYAFEMYDVKNSLPLGDESYTLILNILCREELMQVMTLEEEYRMEKQRSREEGIEIGKSQGIEIGLQEGKQEGKQETQRSIATKMKESGMEVQQIAEMTELSIEEIEKL